MGCRRKNTLCLSLDFGANDGTLLPRLTRLETSPSPQKRLVLKFPIDCVGATSSTRDELNQFITAVNSFHPALKYTWEIFDTFLAFLDIKLFIESNGLCTSVRYKPTDSHTYLLYSSSHPSHARILFLILSFLDLVAFLVKTLIFPQ